MKRRGKNRLQKRRTNRLHNSRLEHLEDRRLLAVTFDAGQAGDSDHNGSTGFTLSPNLYVDKEAMVNDWAKFNTSLASLAVQYEMQIDQGIGQGDLTFETSAQLQGDLVLVDLIASQEAATLAADLQGLGATRVSAYGRVVSAWVPVSSLSSIAELDSAQFASAVTKPQTSVGLVDNLADIALRTDEARSAFGVDGTGITIGIISDSFDALGGYATDIATGDLPPNIDVLSEYPFGTDEGRALAQLIHDIAPGATLMFYSAANGMADFANGIIELAQAGADVIVDDIIYFAEPMFQDGIIAQAVDAVVNAGVSYFSAAGNDGRSSYQSVYRDASITGVPGSDDDDDDNEWFGAMHDFDAGSGVDTRLSVTIPSGATFMAALQWVEPTASAGGMGSASDYDFWLVTEDGAVVDFSIGLNGGNDPFEMLQFTNTTGNSQFEIIVTRYSGPDTDLIKFVGFGWDLQGITINEFDTQSSTLYGHANATGAAAVGAAYYLNTPEFGESPPLLQSYSSAGNTLIYFEPDGTKLPIFESRRSLRFVAPDGTNTTFFGQDVPEDADLFPNFFGTSAAAPHAAAVAALMLEVNPNLSPWQVYEILEDTAIDMDRSGYDFDTGYGLINAVAALGATPASTGGGGDGGGTPGGSCGIPLPEGTVSFAGAIGGNFFASNHAILDGSEPGGLGYDEAVLDFLRGNGTQNEIPKSQYSIAVIGNETSDWAFSNGTRLADGYERTTFYNINFITPQIFQELIQYDALIILSGEDAVAGGLTDEEMELWATARNEIATAVNNRGLDLWVGASGGSDAYFDFLPTGALATEDVAGLDPLSGYLPTVEGQLIGLTVDMTNSSDAEYYFVSRDNDLSMVEYRYAAEAISVIGANVAFFNDEIVPAAAVPGGSTVGLTGFVYNDFDGDGFHDPLEPGVGGARFFIDYNGDGLLGLCEPTATSNAAGQFRLRSAYSGEFEIRQVQAPGTVITTTQPQYVTIDADGTATLSSGALEFGVISGNDGGADGTSGSVPVATGAFLGASPTADDGVIFSHGLKKGANTVTIVSSVERSNVVLNAWMDFNKDGDWNDPGERIFTNLTLQPGQNTYNFTIPNNVFDDSVLPEEARLPIDVRFRVGPTWNVGPEANDAFGEIEDYEVFISQEADSGLRATDDVFEYVEDQDGQVFNVLANDTSFFGRTLSIVPGSVTNVSPTTPPLDIRVSADGTRIIFDADGVSGLGQDITFEYTVQDSAGNTATATVTLVTPIEPATPVGGNNNAVATFNNAGKAADVNGDGRVTGQDLALLIREFEGGARSLPQLGQAPTNFKRFIDVNADHVFNSVDLLYFINKIRGSAVESEPIMSEPAALLAEGGSDTDAPIPGAITATVSTPQVSPTSGSVLWASPRDGASGTRVVLKPSSVEPVSRVLAEIYSNDAFLESLSGEDEALLLIEHASANGDDGLGASSDESESSIEDQVFGDDSWEEELLPL